MLICVFFGKGDFSLAKHQTSILSSILMYLLYIKTDIAMSMKEMFHFYYVNIKAETSMWGVRSTVCQLWAWPNDQKLILFCICVMYFKRGQTFDLLLILVSLTLLTNLWMPLDKAIVFCNSHLTPTIWIRCSLVREQKQHLVFILLGSAMFS